MKILAWDIDVSRKAVEITATKWGKLDKNTFVIQFKLLQIYIIIEKIVV